MLSQVIRSPIVSPLHGHQWLIGDGGYPLDAILHWDADIDAFSEQTGGVHTFNHSVLSPQYQRAFDGSYSNVGAKPAVDVFGGEKWLRSCGAVTNLLPSGSEDFLASAGWTFKSNITNNPTTIGSVPSRRLTVINTGSGAYIGRFQSSFDSAPFFSVLVKKGNCDWVYFGFSQSGDHGLCFNLATGVVGSAIGTAIGSIEALGGGVFRLHIWSSTAYKNFIATAPRPCNGDGVFTVTAGQYVDVAQFQLTATPYPVPYVPPGVTQPASNATTTNGVWFALPDGSPLWQALTGQPFTLATRVRMGVGSGDIPATSDLGIIVGRANTVDVMYSGSRPGLPRIVRSYDGVGSVGYENISWARNGIHKLVVQVNTAGTQFRTGHIIEGTDASIQWYAWANFDGSFNPSTLYRLMLGYNNAYPMWFNKITAWKKQVTDVEILEAMA